MDYENFVVPVIMAGGRGRRLWPLSRAARPKPFQSPGIGRSMLIETTARLQGLTGSGSLLVICAQNHASLAREQLRRAGMQAVLILEPEGRGTAAAGALAAWHHRQQNPVLLLLPADHWIASKNALHEAVRAALPQARRGSMVCLGISATSPHTGYGYILAGAKPGDDGARHIISFHEKPKLNDARRYVEHGGYFHNCGIFLCTAAHYLEELRRHAPAVLEACSAAYDLARGSDDSLTLEANTWHRCPLLSIDHAIMEHTEKGLLIPLQTAWSDLGTWQDLWHLGPFDDSGNVTQGNMVLEDTHDSYVRASDRMIATLGVRDLIIVDGGDALLVAHRERAQEVGRLAEQLSLDEKQDATPNERAATDLVHRPWGWFEVLLAQESGYQVKRIVVYPGQALSLQYHQYRTEHWVVVSGQASGVCGERPFQLHAGQSICIPQGTKHRLRNAGEERLEVIEVQMGSYLGEDDIIRLQDDYGRQ